MNAVVLVAGIVVVWAGLTLDGWYRTGPEMPRPVRPMGWALSEALRRRGPDLPGPMRVLGPVRASPIPQTPMYVEPLDLTGPWPNAYGGATARVRVVST